MDVAALLGVPAVDDDLPRIEATLRSAAASRDPFLSEIAGHLASAGGKRLRPALATVAARCGSREATDDVVRGGVAVELVHLGSLYHDDVMDEADSRRGVESVNARWGNLVAILAGDFLLARASEIAASLGTEVAGLLAATIGRLCEGQVGELKTAFDPSRTEEAYLLSIEGKTASLLATACRVGALVAELPRPHVEALTAFGTSLGMVFQIRDDILDLIGTDEELGKPAGQDLVEGVYTLPVIRALHEPDLADELHALLGRPLDIPERDKAREIVRSSQGVTAAVDLARGYAAEAEEALSEMDANPVRDALAGSAHRLVDSIPAGR